MRTLRPLFRNDRASAATEMALSLPIMFALLFGSMELGNYFLSEHKVVKAVRDGARYAARRPFTDYDAACTPSADVVDDTRNVTRTGTIDGTGTPRMASWTDAGSISVIGACDATGVYTGIYAASPIATPVVTVAATVQYTPVLGQLGLTDTTLTLNASSQAAVTGI
jgi:Flp pilus assembly protein TadG